MTRRRVSAIVTALAAAAAVFVIGFGIARNTAKVETVEERQRVVCEESNRLRAGERNLWGRIGQLSQQNPNPNVPKAQRDKQLQEFLTYVNTLFAPLDCNDPSVLKHPPGTPAVALPVVTKVETNTVTKVRTVFVTVPGGTRTRIVCQLPNGRPCP